MLKDHINKRSFALAALAFGTVLFATGCSTWQEKTQGIVSQASTSLETANALGAEKYAPKVMESANKYMAMAKQALGEGRLQDAQRYAEKATVDSELAGVQANNGGHGDEIKSLQEKLAKLMP